MKHKLDILDIMRIWTEGSIIIGLLGYIVITIYHSNPIPWIFSIGLFSYIGFIFISAELNKYDPDIK